MGRHVDQASALFGLVSVMELQQVCRVNRTTALRWKAGKTRMPFAAYALMMYTIEGRLPPISGDAWRGWRLAPDGRLYAPDLKRGFTPEHIRMLDILIPMFSWSEQLRGMVSGLHRDGVIADEVLNFGKPTDDKRGGQRRREHANSLDHNRLR